MITLELRSHKDGVDIWCQTVTTIQQSVDDGIIISLSSLQCTLYDYILPQM